MSDWRSKGMKAIIGLDEQPSLKVLNDRVQQALTVAFDAQAAASAAFKKLVAAANDLSKGISYGDDA